MNSSTLLFVAVSQVQIVIYNGDEKWSNYVDVYKEINKGELQLF